MNILKKWRQYCLNQQLPSQTSKSQAINHYIANNIYQNNNKYEQFNLNINHNKNIIIYHHTIPTFDRDSGSRRLIEIIKILIDLGYKVYFFTHDRSLQEKQKYVDFLVQSLGVEVINTKITFQHLVRNIGINFDIVWFYGYELYDKYISEIKNITPTIKTIVDSIDVHWLRLTRGNLLSLNNKEKEKKAYNNADVVFAVTEEDRSTIWKECPNANIKILSNIHDIQITTKNTDHPEKNLIFVGGSNHTPNIEASLKAITIFNLFIAQYPEYKTSKLYIVGHTHDQSTIDLAKKSDANISIEYGLSDEVLINLYSTKIAGALCPITWGAGIKGKICEAISYDIPVITTNIGNEGLNLQHLKHGFIADSDTEFVESIYKLFNMSKEEKESLINAAKNRLYLLTNRESATDVIVGTLQCKKIVLSIATHNNSILLERCINSILQNTKYPNYILHITANGCTDNTASLLRRLKTVYGDLIHFTINTINQHFIHAHNNTISLYPNNDIVLLNDDMEFHNDTWLNHLYSTAYSAGYVGCAGGTIMNYNSTISERGSILFNDGTGMNLDNNKTKSETDHDCLPIKYTGYTSGCLMYMKRNMINKFGALDTRYHPCYYEDSDWQYNIHIHGYKTAISKFSEVMHLGSVSSTRIAESFKEECLSKNRQKFLDKYKNYNIENLNK